MTIGLISDCLGEIFKCFPDDNNALYQCMLVNKMWCESAVAILWKDPFAMLIKTTDSLSLYDDNIETDLGEREQALGLLQAFIHQLPEESRSILIRNGIKVPKITARKSMFDYLNFVNTLDMVRFSLAVSFWLFRGGKYSSRTRFQCYLLEQEIYKMILWKCPHITKVRCVEDLLDHDAEQLSVFNFTYLPPDSLGLFSKIREFECSAGLSTDQIYFILSQLITKLDTIKIKSAPEYFAGSYGLSEFIMSQQSLRNVEFLCNNKVDDDLHNECKEIGKALEKQAKSLTRLKIHGFHGVPFETFRNCESLRELTLYFVDEMPQDIEERLTQFKLKNLYKFEVRATSLDLSKIAKFIRYNGKRLEEVKVETENSVDNEKSGSILEAVANCCPNVISFHGPIDPTNESQLRHFCKQCKKLNTLGLNFVEEKFDACDTYDILNIIGEHAPRNIFYFILEGDWELMKCTLEQFLKQRQSIAPFKVIYVGFIGGLRKRNFFELDNYYSDYDGSDDSDSQYGQKHLGDFDFYKRANEEELDYSDLVNKSCDDDFDWDGDFDMSSLTKYIEEGLLEIRSPEFKF